MKAILSKKTRASPRFTILTVCLASFTDCVLYGICIPVLAFALPKQAGLRQEDVQKWNAILIEIFGGTIAIGSVFIGWLGDLTPSRQAPFVLGVLMLGLSTLLFALAHSLEVLVTARVLQGLSATVAETVGSAMLLDKVGQDKIGEAFGWKGLASTLGFFAGPIVGGTLYLYAGYFAVFVPVFLLVGIEFTMRLLVIEDRREASNNKRDQSGKDSQRAKEDQPLLRESRSPATQGRNSGSNNKQTLPHEDSLDQASYAEPFAARYQSPVTIGHESPKAAENGLNGKVVGANAKRHSKFSFPALKLLLIPRLSVALFGIMIQNSLAAVFEAVLPLYAHDLFAFNSSQAALTLIPFTIPLLFTPLAGRMVDRSSSMKSIATVTYAACGPLNAMLGLATRNTRSSLGIIAAATLLLGVARILVLPILAKELTESVKDLETRMQDTFPEHGVFSLVYGLNSSVNAIGLIGGTFYGAAIRSAFGWPTLSYAMTALSIFATALIMGFTGGNLSWSFWRKTLRCTDRDCREDEEQ